MKQKILIILSSFQTLILLAILGFMLYQEGYLYRQAVEYIDEKPILLTGNDTIKLSADDPVWGSNNAPITMVAYIDFECPYCKDLYKNIKALEDEFIKTGKVKVVFRDLPLSIHKRAKHIAVVAECARRNGKFWEFADMALSNTQKLDTTLLKGWASDLGVNLRECLSDEEAIATVRKDLHNAVDRELRGTPAVFINNLYYRGTKSVADLRKLFQNKKILQNDSGSCED